MSAYRISFRRRSHAVFLEKTHLIFGKIKEWIVEIKQERQDTYYAKIIELLNE